MNREYHRWYSPALGRDMEMLVFGHAGARALIFPTSKGKFYEWEDRQMMGPACMGAQIANGSLQVFCVDSVDAESWYAHHRHPAARAARHTQYDSYLLNEVLPLSRHLNPNPFLITLGASFGAYHAVNFALRHPDQVGRTLGLSGIYEIDRWTDGYSDENIYFNNPVSFVPGEEDPVRLAALRQMDIILVTGRDDPMRYSSEYLSAVLWNKGVGNALRIWDGWSHDWPYWIKMINLYMGGHD